MEKKNASPAIRDKTGRFVPGISGNISGRPKRTKEQREALEQIRELAQETPVVLAKLLHSKDTPPALKLRCVEILLDRVYGKANQPIKIEDEGNHSFEIYIGSHGGEYWPSADVIEQDGKSYIALAGDDLKDYQRFKEAPDEWKEEYLQGVAYDH